MKLIKSHLFFCAVIMAVFTTYGQGVSIDEPSEERSLYLEFSHFFDKEIKQQGVKGNWIFRLNEINGLHKFDYNHDGFMDTFMEFNAISVEGEATIYQFSVLFENKGDENYRFIDFIKTDNLQFLKFDEGCFIFIQNSAKSAIEIKSIYLLEESQFMLRKSI
jgi:hypothetical protein